MERKLPTRSPFSLAPPYFSPFCVQVSDAPSLACLLVRSLLLEKEMSDRFLDVMHNLACTADNLNLVIVRLRISHKKLVPPPRVTRVFCNRFLLALAYGCSFMHCDWTRGISSSHTLIHSQ